MVSLIKKKEVKQAFEHEFVKHDFRHFSGTNSTETLKGASLNESCLCIGSNPHGTFSMETVQTNTSSSQYYQYTDNDCERPQIREMKQIATLVSLKLRLMFRR